MLPNTIIAGTNKAGTTSLFRYLADHPAVCPSKIKEVRFFSRFENPSYEYAQEFYGNQFGDYAGQQILLEASPDYLLHGKTTANSMAGILPEAKLIFILREPLSRLISAFFRRKTRRHESLKGIDIYDYLEIVLSGNAEKVSHFPLDLRWVDYSKRLREFLDYFPSENIAVRFFDHLGADSSAFVIDICEFLNIDPAYYRTYSFDIENRTRSVKSSVVHRAAHTANLRLEPVFNRYPSTRKLASAIYSVVNYRNLVPAVAIDREQYTAREIYTDQVKALMELLDSTYPTVDLPIWLNCTESGAISTGRDDSSDI